MGYEWYDRIDRIVWHLEECLEAAANAGGMMGMAPSAGDEARARLRRTAEGKKPLELVHEVEKITEADVREATLTLAEAAVEHAAGRGSHHVAREDIASAEAPYPWSR